MKSVVIQIIATLIVSLANFFIGFNTAWSSYTLEFFESDQSPFPKLTPTEASLVGSLPMLGCFISTLLSGVLCDGVGRRKTDILSGICFVLSWSLITTTNNVTILLIGRFMLGISHGIHFMACIPFIGELAKPSILGNLFSVLTFSYCFGGLASYACGWFCSYDVINYLNLSLSVVFVFLVSWLKETPAYLLGKGKEKEALKSLQFYRGASKPTEEIMDEFNYLKDQQPRIILVISDLEKPLTDEKQKLHEETMKNDVEDVSAWQMIKSSKATQRALVISTANIVLMVCGGTIAVCAYAAKFFKLASPSISEHLCSVILALSFAVGSFIAVFVTDLVGRRTLMLASSVFSTCCLLVLVSLLRWGWAPQWSLPAAVLAYCCTFQLGVANVPFIQLNEVFPTKIKSFASIVGFSFMNIANFIVLALFGTAVDLLGFDGTFLMFAIICVFTCIFNMLFLRETKGVSLKEAQAMYEIGYLYRKNRNNYK